LPLEGREMFQRGSCKAGLLETHISTPDADCEHVKKTSFCVDENLNKTGIFSIWNSHNEKFGSTTYLIAGAKYVIAVVDGQSLSKTNK